MRSSPSGRILAKQKVMENIRFATLDEWRAEVDEDMFRLATVE
jgi:hypothetical protein